MNAILQKPINLQKSFIKAFAFLDFVILLRLNLN